MWPFRKKKAESVELSPAKKLWVRVSALPKSGIPNAGNAIIADPEFSKEVDSDEIIIAGSIGPNIISVPGMKGSIVVTRDKNQPGIYLVEPQSHEILSYVEGENAQRVEGPIQTHSMFYMKDPRSDRDDFYMFVIISEKDN